jgi:hypothetical protein
VPPPVVRLSLLRPPIGQCHGTTLTARSSLLKPTVPSDRHGLQVVATLPSLSACLACHARRAPLELAEALDRTLVLRSVSTTMFAPTLCLYKRACHATCLGSRRPISASGKCRRVFLCFDRHGPPWAAYLTTPSPPFPCVGPTEPPHLGGAHRPARPASGASPHRSCAGAGAPFR